MKKRIFQNTFRLPGLQVYFSRKGVAMLKRSLSLLVFVCGLAAALGFFSAVRPPGRQFPLTDAGHVWTDNTGVQPITNDFTISPAADVLVVELGWRQQGNGDVPTVTYNGEPLTMAVTKPRTRTPQNSAIFYLASNQLGWATGSPTRCPSTSASPRATRRATAASTPSRFPAWT